jgi:chitin disaccharide deacetylase
MGSFAVPRLIINADDLGYDPAVSAGIVQAMRAGVVTSATLMVNLPHSADGAASARGLAVGLHFNLVRGRPLSRSFPEGLLHDGEFDEAQVDRLPTEVVKDEARAQIERAEALLGRPATHLDVHRHLHRHPGVLEGVASVAQERDLPVRALDAPMRVWLRACGLRVTDHFIGDAGAEPYWTLGRFLRAVEALAPGTTELMCHPGFLPTHVRTGYAEQRVVELQTLTSAEARAALEGAGVDLATFADRW